MKLNSTTKISHQANASNSNTSRKAPSHQNKLGMSKPKQSKKLLDCEPPRIASQGKPINIRKKNLVNLKHRPLDSKMTSSIMKLIKKMHTNAPRPGVHYRARTTEIGNSFQIKRQVSKRECKFKSSGRRDKSGSTPRKSTSRSQRKSNSRKQYA